MTRPICAGVIILFKFCLLGSLANEDPAPVWIAHSTNTTVNSWSGTKSDMAVTILLLSPHSAASVFLAALRHPLASLSHSVYGTDEETEGQRSGVLTQLHTATKQQKLAMRYVC
jgi:hypothetical protein